MPKNDVISKASMVNLDSMNAPKVRIKISKIIVDMVSTLTTFVEYALFYPKNPLSNVLIEKTLARGPSGVYLG